MWTLTGFSTLQIFFKMICKPAELKLPILKIMYSYGKSPSNCVVIFWVRGRSQTTLTIFWFFDQLPPFAYSFYLKRIDIFGRTYPLLRVNVVCERPLNPNWHEGGHFQPPFFLDKILSAEFLSKISKLFWRRKLTSIGLIWGPVKLIVSYKKCL